MAFQRLRRALMVLTCASAALLAACGGSTVVSQFHPTRIVAFGDGFSDLGQVNNRRYTVNNVDPSAGPVNVWSRQVATRFGLPLTSAAQGGTSYATGNARVASPVAASGGAAPTIEQQITSFLNSGGSFGAGDLVLVNGGITDIISEVAGGAASANPGATALANIQQAGNDLGAQVRRIVDAGATHVVVVGAYNLERSPWAIANGTTGTLLNYSTAFNTALEVYLHNNGGGDKVLFVDSAYYYNLLTGTPTNYLGGSGNATTLACTVTDPGTGIGIGPNEVNSALCDTSNVGAVDINTLVFADKIYPTPAAHRLFGDYAYDSKIHSRW